MEKLKRVKITKTKKEAPDTFTFRVQNKLGKIEPGQFVFVSINTVGEAPISVSSIQKKYIELTVKKLGLVTTALFQKKVGDSVYVRGPYGNAFPKAKQYILVAGGFGLAPLKALIEERPKNIKKLFYGACTYRDMIFKDELKNWQFAEMIAEKRTRGCRLATGLVTDLIDKAKLSPVATVIICGPPIMLKFVAQALEKKGFRDRQIYASLEKTMHCGTGICGHCNIGSYYVCKDGPVFRLDKIKGFEEKII
ncbi:MAG: hypothetical protein B6U68_03290 [Candidatus Aenigmarchaeota archaeon ex4484_14]|nr:MAG: hypothetical protein B6U68_03290 [Candidatus Aenigmarchaeota archaeon ex4484_14]